MILTGTTVVLFLLIQLVPYRKDLANPPVTDPVQWSDPQAETIARSACYDCHSNESVWPWYSKIAPSSWLLKWDVDRGRQAMNFSTSHRIDAEEIQEVLEDGGMPPPQYLLLHPEARLSQEQIEVLLNGLP